MSWCWRWRAASGSRRIRISASPMLRTAHRRSASRSSTPTTARSGANGRSKRRRCSAPVRRSEATHLGFGLGALEIVGGRSCLLGRAEHGAKPPGDLGEAQDRFRGDIAIVRQDRSDDVDGAGALIQGLPCLAIGLHAGKDVVSPGSGRIVVEFRRAQRCSHRSGRRKHQAEAWQACHGCHGRQSKPHRNLSLRLALYHTPMTLLIFDCDGVLVDSEHLACEALAELMTTLGYSMTADQAMLAFAGRSLKDVLARAERLLSRPIPEDMGERAARQLMARFRRELKAVDGVKDAIAALPHRRCVASSSATERLMLSLDVTGLSPLFGNNVFSAVEVANGKPAPDLFFLAARRLGEQASSCIVIEDSVLGVEAAGAAGMAAIGFAGASHANRELAKRLADA